MRFKYYIRGFGFGMILTTIVLIVSFKLHGEMTDDQIRKEAMKLGMVENVDTQKNPSDNKVPIEKNTENDESVKTDTQKPDTQKPDTQKEPDSTIVDTQKPDTQTPETTTSIKLTIENGDSCRMVAEKLYANNLIDDVEKFREYIRKNKWANDFHTGVYMIPVGSSYDDIAKILIPSYNK